MVTENTTVNEIYDYLFTNNKELCVEEVEFEDGDKYEEIA